MRYLWHEALCPGLSVPRHQLVGGRGTHPPVPFPTQWVLKSRSRFWCRSRLEKEVEWLDFAHHGTIATRLGNKADMIKKVKNWSEKMYWKGHWRMTLSSATAISTVPIRWEVHPIENFHLHLIALLLIYRNIAMN